MFVTPFCRQMSVGEEYLGIFGLHYFRIVREASREEYLQKYPTYPEYPYYYITEPVDLKDGCTV